MKGKIIISVLILFFVSGLSAYANQERRTLDDIVGRMQKELNLTDAQVEAIKPIIKENTEKRQEFFDSIAGETSSNKAEIKRNMRKFKEEMNEKLSKILSPEQMEKLKEKQNLRESLNKDQIDYSETIGAPIAINPEGGSMQF